MLVNGKHFKTVWSEGKHVKMIHQNLLPFDFKIHTCHNYVETAYAIRDMIVRGAGAIGCTAALAMAQAFIEHFPDWNQIDNARRFIESMRPTAQNLFYATKFVAENAQNHIDALELAQLICSQDSNASKAIGEYGAELILNNYSVATHCNAGWLAFTDYGTALAPIYEASRQGKKLKVFVDETRPRSQGARLTAWELYNEGIEHYIIADNATAFFMQKGNIDMMIVGADRIAANGDVANKIGTLEKAILARHFGIPFYVAAPKATFDIHCATGKDIPIEFRNQNEVLYATGPNENNINETILLANPGSPALNPAFDVSPAELISGIITEVGIIKADYQSINKLFKNV
jgi:S-methyl-5-thioribose-1-phosphate isomerase